MKICYNEENCSFKGNNVIWLLRSWRKFICVCGSTHWQFIMRSRWVCIHILLMYHRYLPNFVIATHQFPETLTAKGKKLQEIFEPLYTYIIFKFLTVCIAEISNIKIYTSFLQQLKFWSRYWTLNGLIINRHLFSTETYQMYPPLCICKLFWI